MDHAGRTPKLSALNDFILDEAIVYPIATHAQKLFAVKAVQDSGHRRHPRFTFTDTWLDA